MKEVIKRIILAYKRSFSKKLKRRSAIDRYKARQYYKTHKTKIRLHRKQYMKKTKTFAKARKLFKRTKPTWAVKRNKARTFKPKIYKPKIFKPKKLSTHRPGKIYAPKRRTAKT
jgi:hypothetical protein